MREVKPPLPSPSQGGWPGEAGAGGGRPERGEEDAGSTGMPNTRSSPMRPGPTRLRFACHARRLIVELDGSQHTEEAHADADALRDAQLGELACLVRRIANSEVRRDLSAVADGVCRLALSRPAREPRKRVEP